MGEWVIGALINLFGSIIINFGTNLLKLGHDERGRQLLLNSDGTNEKAVIKPIIHYHTWRVGILFFALGNCLNFVSFGYAAQVLIATAFIVLGNIFLVAFGNHQSPVYTPEQLADKFSNVTFLMYCLILILTVALHQIVYKKGVLLSVEGLDLKPYWQMLLPFSYAVVSGAVGSCSVLFAKSLSNLLRLSFASGNQLHSWFTYSMLLLFLSTAGFWMARLNEGLALFDAILIVPMFQIAWTFFSISTGFVYFQEYQVFDTLRTTIFVLGVISVFIGISLLAPDDPKGMHTFSGGEIKDTSVISPTSSDLDRLVISSEDSQVNDVSNFAQTLKVKVASLVLKGKTIGSLSLGLGEHSMHASSVLVMPMVSSKITGFRGNGFDRTKLFSLEDQGWSKISIDEDQHESMLETITLIPSQTISID